MAVFIFLNQLWIDALDKDEYAIVLMIAILLLLISYFRRLFIKAQKTETEEQNREFKDELNTLKREYDKVKEELLECEKKLKEELANGKRLKDEHNQLQDSFNKLRKRYSENYAELLDANKSKKILEAKSLFYRLSPHFLKNIINTTFLKAKHNIEENNISCSFSFFGIKFYGRRKIDRIVDIYINRINSSLQLLIDLLNYLIYSTSVKEISIDVEIKYLKCFCELLAINRGIKVDFIENIDDRNISIPPTILFYYIDNAIKHGNFKKGCLIIRIEQNGDHILKYSVESPMYSKDNSCNDPGGIGNDDFKKYIDISNLDIKIDREIVNDVYIAKMDILR
ncbi:MAG: hypothetical protein N4A72_07775 [Bacteroidales bacterium]|jgi:LytS/YehU family sensor histidine kinase|nr:hypothetical protein [Bacteroidales bacterium]